MDQTNNVINTKIYEEEEIDQELMCPSCLQKLQSPRILPCGDSICFECILIDKNKTELCKCPVCNEIHKIDVNSLPRIKILEKLLNKKPTEIDVIKTFKTLKEKLEVLSSNRDKLERYLNFPHEIIQDHCKGLLNQIDLTTEKAHRLVDRLSDSLINQVNEYEKECIAQFESLSENECIVPIKSVLNETKRFFHEKTACIKSLDSEELECSIVDSNRLISTIQDNFCSLESNLFNNGKMKFFKNENEITSDFLGELRAFTVIETHIKYSWPKKRVDEVFYSDDEFSESWHMSAHLTDERNLLTISNSHNSVELSLIDQRGLIMKNEIILEHIYDVKVKSLLHKERLVLLAQGYDKGDNNWSELLIFDTNLKQINKLKISDVSNIVSVAANNSKYYCLLTSYSNKNLLYIYDFNLNEVAVKGLDAKKNTDAFFFYNNTSQIRVTNQSIFILENKLIKLMNIETGIVSFEFPVVGSSFEIHKNYLVLFDKVSQIRIYNKGGKEQRSIVLSNELKHSDWTFFSNLDVIEFNKNNAEITIFQLNF
jgi:hypothetical protein